MVYKPCSEPGRSGDRRRYTNMNETRNETNRPPGYLWRETGPNHLTFRFSSGFADSGVSFILRANYVSSLPGHADQSGGSVVRLPSRPLVPW